MNRNLLGAAAFLSLAAGAAQAEPRSIPNLLGLGVDPGLARGVAEQEGRDQPGAGDSRPVLAPAPIAATIAPLTPVRTSAAAPGGKKMARMPWQTGVFQ